jgi:hypothetical protein
MLLSFGFAVNSLPVFFLWKIFKANAASPPLETEPTTINPAVDKQNGHMVHLTFLSSSFPRRVFCEFLSYCGDYAALATLSDT